MSELWTYLRGGNGVRDVSSGIRLRRRLEQVIYVRVSNGVHWLSTCVEYSSLAQVAPLLDQVTVARCTALGSSLYRIWGVGCNASGLGCTTFG